MYIERKLEKKLKDYLSVPEILAVIGPRQSGKTTLIQKICSELENSIYLSFEDRQLLELFETDIKSFEELYFKSDKYKYIFIDEFQYASEGGKDLKYLFDFNPGKKIIISGSSSIDLSIKAIKYLVGRIFILNIYQLDFEEFLSFKNPDLLRIIKQQKGRLTINNTKVILPDASDAITKKINLLYEEFGIFGGYPRVVTANNSEERIEILKNIYSIFFLREVKEILRIAEDYKLTKLIKALALQIGSQIDYQNLGSLADLNYSQTKINLNLLEKTFITQSIQPFFKNKSTELVKNPKIFFIDTGLRNLVINNFQKLSDRPDKGALLENILFCELVKDEFSINYWRTKSQAEVDLIAQKNQAIIPIEIKSRLVKETSTRSMHSFIKKYNPEVAIIFSDNLISQKNIDDKKMLFLPFWIGIPESIYRKQGTAFF
jgi:uncharacterized protein